MPGTQLVLNQYLGELALSIVKLGFSSDTCMAVKMKSPFKENDPVMGRIEHMANILH